jgi:hypothetical protein
MTFDIWPIGIWFPKNRFAALSLFGHPGYSSQPNEQQLRHARDHDFAQ